MYARSTTIQAQPSFIEMGIEHIRSEVMPELREMDGCVGLSLLVNRTSGRCIATSAWESAGAMHASAEWVRSIRERAATVFSGLAGPAGASTVEEWEIDLVHRDHRADLGAYVRASWLKIRPDRFDAAVDFYKIAILPAIEELRGFCSASLMLDRASGRAVSSVTFDSMDAMQYSTDRARSLRTALLRDLGADQLDVAEFELAVAHLRVPELV